MKIENLNTIEMLESFLDGSHPVAFSVLGSKTLVNFRYTNLFKKDKGTIIRYLLKMTE